MSRYFTADWHINSTNILKYANRPYKSWQSAATSLIGQCNAVASKDDCVFHVGDLIMLSNDRHDAIEDVLDANAYKPKDIKQRIAANFIAVAGNHDDGHSFEADCKSITLNLNQNYWNVSVAHYPSTHECYRYVGNGNRQSCSNGIHIHLCGHVHEKWLLNFDAMRKVLNVNVGVDVWDFKPVRDAEITDLLDYFRANLWTKIANDGSHWSDFVITRKAFDEFKHAHSAEVRAQREARKAEKLAKKGLTPEDCERRKIEAMKKKGLL